MNNKKIKIGTRGSNLALFQTNLLLEALLRIEPQFGYEIVVIKTIGDKVIDKPLAEFGGKGVFVSEFEDALTVGEIDFAVHSAKDMPVELAEGLDIIGVLKREDPRDVMITMADYLPDTGKRAIIGTSSLRRQLQAVRIFGNIECRPLRGNIDTRLKKLYYGLYDGIILAAAGIKRLNLDKDNCFKYKYLEIDEFIPAGGQGIIAVEGKKDSVFASLLNRITDNDSMIELEIERCALKILSGGCSDSTGVFSKISADSVTIWMMREIGGRLIYLKESSDIGKHLELAESMAERISGDKWNG